MDWQALTSGCTRIARYNNMLNLQIVVLDRGSIILVEVVSVFVELVRSHKHLVFLEI